MSEVHLVDVASANVLLSAFHQRGEALLVQTRTEANRRRGPERGGCGEMGAQFTEFMPALVRVAKDQRVLVKTEAMGAVILHKPGGETARQPIVELRTRLPIRNRAAKLLPIRTSQYRLGLRSDDRQLRRVSLLCRAVEEDKTWQTPAPRSDLDRRKLQRDAAWGANKVRHAPASVIPARFSNENFVARVAPSLLMKPRFALFPALLLASLPLCAQESAPAETLELIPSNPAPSEPASPAESLPLIPESPEPAKKPKGKSPALAPVGELKKEKKSSTEATADEQAQRIRFREAKTRALRDPAVQREWERSLQARSDFEKREALASYYKLLFARIAKLDKSLKPQATLTQQRALRGLTQTRIDPTEPLDPQERAERFRE